MTKSNKWYDKMLAYCKQGMHIDEIFSTLQAEYGNQADILKARRQIEGIYNRPGTRTKYAK